MPSQAHQPILVSIFTALVYDTVLQFPLEVSILPLCFLSCVLLLTATTRCPTYGGMILTLIIWVVTHFPLLVQSGRFQRCSIFSFDITSFFLQCTFKFLRIDLNAEVYTRFFIIGTTSFACYSSISSIEFCAVCSLLPNSVEVSIIIGP